MRKFVKKMKMLFILFCIGNTMFVFGQEKKNAKPAIDKIIMLDGTIKEGKVLLFDENTIRFSYFGETSEYVLNKELINEIKFSSGRTEKINHSESDIELLYLSTSKQRNGKLAVLPFNYITNDTSIDINAMSLKLQNNCYNSLRENTMGVVVQDPITTNSILVKAGVNPSTLFTKTPKEIALILTVQYVVYGVANVSNVGTSTSGSDMSTYHENKVKNTGSKPVVTREIPYEYGYPYVSNIPQGSYQFSYDSENNKLTEKVTNDFGNVKTHTHFENGELIDARVTAVSEPWYGSNYYYDDNYYRRNRKSVREEKHEKTQYSGTSFSSNNSTTKVDYSTEIDLNFYNDQGISLYSKSRRSFGSSIDSYVATLKYLIKRCPFGTKFQK